MEDKDQTSGGLPNKGAMNTTGGTPFYGISNGNTGNGLTICDKVEQLLEGISRDTLQNPGDLSTKEMNPYELPAYHDNAYGPPKTDAEISETVRKFFANDSKKTANAPLPPSRLFGDHPIQSATERNFWGTGASNGNTTAQQDSVKNITEQMIGYPAKEVGKHEEVPAIAQAHKRTANTGHTVSEDIEKKVQDSSEGSTRTLEQYDEQLKKENEQKAAKVNSAAAKPVTVPEDSEIIDEELTKKLMKCGENDSNASAHGFAGTKSTVSKTVLKSVKMETKDAMQQTDVVTKFHRGRRFSEPATFDLSRSDITELLRKSLKLPVQTLVGSAVQKEVHQPTENNGMEIDTSVLNGNGVEEKQTGQEQNQQHDDDMNESEELDDLMEDYSPTISERDIIDENAPPSKKAKLDPLEIHTESMGADDYEEVDDYSSSSSRSRSPSPQRTGFVLKLGTNQPTVAKETRNSPCSPEPSGTYQRQLINAAAHKKRELLLQAEQLKRRRIIERALGTTKDVRDSPISPDANLNHTATPVYYRVNRDYRTIPRPQNPRENDMTKMVQDKILGEEAIRANGGEQEQSEPVKHTVPLKKTSALNQALAELLSRPVTKIVLEKHHYLPEFRPSHEYIPQIVDSTPYETQEEQMKLLCKISSNNSWVPPNRDAPLPHDRGIDYWNWTAGQFISWIASFCHNKYVLSNLLLANLNGKIIFTHEPDYSLLRNFGLNVEVSNVICHNFRIIKDKCRIYGNLGTLRLPQGFF